MLLISCQTRYSVDEMTEFLPLKSPKSYNVLQDTAFGDYLQTINIVVDEEYYNNTKKLIMEHQKFEDLGFKMDSLHSYNRRNGLKSGAYSFEGGYFLVEYEDSSPRLKNKFLYFFISLKKDSIITIFCRPL